MQIPRHFLLSGYICDTIIILTSLIDKNIIHEARNTKTRAREKPERNPKWIHKNIEGKL